MSTQDALSRLHAAAHRLKVAEQAQKDLAREGWVVAVDIWQVPTRAKVGLYGFSTEAPDGSKYSSAVQYPTNLLALEAGIIDAYDGLQALEARRTAPGDTLKAVWPVPGTATPEDNQSAQRSLQRVSGGSDEEPAGQGRTGVHLRIRR